MRDLEHLLLHLSGHLHHDVDSATQRRCSSQMVSQPYAVLSALSTAQMLQRPESAAALDEMAAIFDNFLADGGAFPELDAPDAL